MSTLSGYGVADVSHVAMFSNFGGTCISDDLRLGPSAGYEGLNHHDIDNSGGLDIGHLVNLIGGKACWEERATSRSDDLPKYLKAQCPLSISIVISDGVADVNHIPVISTIDSSCENLSLGSAASCASF